MLKLLKFVFIAGLTLAAAAVVTGYSVWQRMHEPFKGYATEEQFVDIPSGASTGLTRAEGGMWLAAGIFGMATSIKDLADNDSEVRRGEGIEISGSVKIVADQPSDQDGSGNYEQVSWREVDL